MLPFRGERDGKSCRNNIAILSVYCLYADIWLKFTVSIRVLLCPTQGKFQVCFCWSPWEVKGGSGA